MEAINNAIAEAQRRHFIHPGVSTLSMTALGHLRAAIQDRVRELDGSRIRLSKKDLDTWLTEALFGLPAETAIELRGINLGRLAASLLVNGDPIIDLLAIGVMTMAA
jgi:hypothetical protein